MRKSPALLRSPRVRLAIAATMATCLPAGAEPDERAGEDWWSLQPLQQVTPPPSDRARNGIDGFIEAQLNARGLAPAPEASRRTLIRRLSFDLVGLPPSPAEIEAFVADESPDAYAKLVDRLLASPRHGERWARHWLDVIGYGESHGFEYNQPRNEAWHFRNWVIDALNADMPYDEFARMQLAGDLLSSNAAAGVIATGFLVAGPHNTTRPQSDRLRKAMDQDEMEGRLAAVGQTFLGMTIHCARCHDHKHDPITLKDYYQLAAALAGVTPNVRKVARPGDAARRREIEALQRERRKLVNQRRNITDPVRRGILEARKRDPAARPAPPPPAAAWDFTEGLGDRVGDADVELRHGATRDGRGIQVDGVRAFAASRPLGFDLEAKTLEVWVRLDGLDQRGGGAMSVQTSDGHTFDAIVYGEKEAKRWMAGSEFFRRTRSFGGPEEGEARDRPTHIAMVYDADGRITAYRDGQPYGKRYQGGGPQVFTAGRSQVVFGVRHGAPGGNRMLKGTIVKARLHDRALSAEAVAASGQFNGVVSDTDIEAALTEEQRGQLGTVVSRLAEVAARLRTLEGGDEPLSVWAVRPGRPPPTHVLARGDVTQPGEEVAPAGIAAFRAVPADWGLTPEASDADRRRKLAEWITRPDNPLFARVIVNRLWHHHFGTGIVATPNDFGFSGDRPSHPELLDWLAGELRNDGWRLKATHRRIVLSATYRQAAVQNRPAARVDADNRLLWRMNPRRLEAEALRDAMLQVAGKLNLEAGGPGYRDVREYKFKGSHFYDPVPQDRPEQFRRTVYRFSPRGAKRSLLDTFDRPDPSAITPCRAVTTTPLQSLALMNNDLVFLLAEAFARRVESEAGADSVAARVESVYALAYGRPPEPPEIELAKTFVDAHGLAAYCRVIFNSNEFLHVR